MERRNDKNQPAEFLPDKGFRYRGSIGRFSPALGGNSSLSARQAPKFVHLTYIVFRKAYGEWMK